VPVSAKQRPHASPGPPPGIAPNASWFNAAVNPLPPIPQAMDGQSVYHRARGLASEE
jgi:hypothetical protein